MNDTIVAISSALAPGLRGIVRLSGPRAFAIAGRHYAGELPPLPYGHSQGKISIQDWQTDVPGVLYFMRAPNSYTGEDVAEIHTFSALPLLHKLVDMLVAAGARPAQPGEFTRRAFVSGRLDLAQVEAVHSLIAASHEAERRLAVLGLTGALSQRLQFIQQEIAGVLALLETYIDFVEEDVGPAPQQEMETSLTNVSAMLEKMAVAAPVTTRTRVTVCLVGLPNAGKSTLFNALLQREAAITSPIPGTTLDYLEDDLIVQDTVFRLIDTPGIMQQPTAIHARAQQKAREIWKAADLLLYLLDGSTGLTSHHQESLAELPEVPTLLVITKGDLPAAWPAEQIAGWRPGAGRVTISVRAGSSLDDLRDWLGRHARHALEHQEPALLSARQRYAAQTALDALSQALTGLRQGVSYEFIALDLRAALSSLGELVGSVTSEHILDRIFAQFCLGK